MCRDRLYHQIRILAAAEIGDPSEIVQVAVIYLLVRNDDKVLFIRGAIIKVPPRPLTRFEKLAVQYEDEQEQAQARLEEIQRQQQIGREREQDIDRFMAGMSRHCGVESLDAAILSTGSVKNNAQIGLQALSE